jgi:carboxypeptidase PM20D1
MFDTLGRHSTFVYKMIFSNLWLFSGVLNMICKKSGGEINALVRTTVAFTQATGSSAPNVIPPEASIVSNIRLNPMDSSRSALEYLKKTVNDPDVEVRMISGMNPSVTSEVGTHGWNMLCEAVAESWQGAIVAPYLMFACSDSRHWGRISNKVYRFSAMALTSEERATIHGNNERVKVETVAKTVEFYIRLIKKL